MHEKTEHNTLTVVCLRDSAKGLKGAAEKSCFHEKQLLVISSTYNLIDPYYHSLSVDVTQMVSNDCPDIAKEVMVPSMK